MGFLGDLAGQLSSKFNLGENITKSLNSDGVRYGALGDFASKFDQSAERRYLEEGYLRRDAFNSDSKQFEILMQEPSATVLVKKRMLSSLADSYRTDYMDSQDKLYYKSMMALFQNKCEQIAALEKISKIQKIATSMNEVDDQLVSLLMSYGSGMSSLFSETTYGKEVQEFNSTLSAIRKIYAFNKPSMVTNWVTDDVSLFKNKFGQGTGVIEITNFTSITTTVSTDINSPGSFTLNISDPYESMVISEYDIEKAISDSNNPFINASIFETTRRDSETLINDLTSRLNSYRRSRGASNISFRVNTDTILGRRLTAIIEGNGLEIPFEYSLAFIKKEPDVKKETIYPSGSALLGGLDDLANWADSDSNVVSNNGVTVPKEFLLNGDAAGFEGLKNKPMLFGDIRLSKDSDKKAKARTSTQSELAVFQSLVAAIYNKISLEGNSKNALFQNNDSSNYARRKLRFNFLGKNIIQPMDTIHIHINSKSQFDDKLLGGLKNMFNGLNVIQTAGNLINNTMNQISGLFTPNTLSVYAEKSMFVGSSFPNKLWYLMRSQFVNEKEGTHVFAGIVNSSAGNFGDGKFTVAIQGSDNLAYLTMGKVNQKPGTEDWSGRIFDPITPFKTSFDSVTTNYSNEIPTLLDDNVKLLRTGLMKHKWGPAAGKQANALNCSQDKKIDTTNNQVIQTFYAPDGLVYKWKEGIGSFIQYGSSFELNNPSNTGNPPITADPFAGQDVMNVISLLATGIPYNFSTYLKATNNFDKNSEANSFYTTIANDIQKRNALWGDFIPFKNLVMNEENTKLANQGLIAILKQNSDIEKNLQELNDLNTKAAMNGLSIIINDVDVAREGQAKDNAAAIAAKSKELRDKIEDSIDDLDDYNESYFVQVGDDINFDFDEFLKEDSKGAKLGDPKERRTLRRKTNFLTRRMSYNIRANQDKNLLIIDDSYDKDYDIAAFNSELASSNFSPIYNNEFLNAKEKINVAANLLNLEVFCDTQGHIRVRPPQYNRMPSSIFNKMMFQKRTLNITYFPDFLNKLFETQLSTLREELEIIEDEIRLDCALLDMVDDNTSQAFISGTGGQATAFAFISSRDSGLIDSLDSLKEQALPNTKEHPLFSKIEGQATNTKNIFDNSTRYDYILKRLTPGKQPPLPNTTETIDKLITRLKRNHGVNVSTKDFMIIQQSGAVEYDSKSIDVFKITKDLASKLSKRQKTIKSFYESLKNSAEFRSLDDPNASNALIGSGIFNNNKIPEVVEHMIEDESYDDYGTGSGQRYIIKNSQIKSYTISENPPEYCYVEVEGTLNNFDPTAGAKMPSAFPKGGNPLVTGSAIDYDLWRSYGYKDAAKITVPFLSNPQSQCAPYAVSLLSRARKNILQGTVTIVGNEYMQPGEVVYLENRGLLFYVSKVAHSYTQGSSFTTALTLTYGHPPGDYIPTTLDIIGKMIYNNKDAGIHEVQRQSSSFNESNYGCLILDPYSSPDTDTDKNKLGGAVYGPINTIVLNNLAYTTSYMIGSNENKGINYNSKIELRVYYDSKSKDQADKDIKQFADDIKAILTGGADMDGVESIRFKNDVDVVMIDLSPNSTKIDHRCPSQKAWLAVRNLVDKSVEDGTLAGDAAADDIRAKKTASTLYKYIVDCWVSLTPVPTEPENLQL